jgi:hypothetical protein
MSEFDLLRMLKTQLVNFLDELIESFPGEPDFVIFRIFVENQLPVVDIMKYIIEHLCPLQEMIKNRDDKFFLENNILFQEMESGKIDRVNHFKRLWTSGKLDKSDKETIWKWFASFINIANKYKNIHTKA